MRTREGIWVAERVVLHVGAMKSGTSFLQNVLGTHKETLAEHGVLFAGPRWMSQVRAVREISQYGVRGQTELSPTGPWQALADEINAWDGTAVVSMEFLGPRSKVQIERIVESFPGARVDAVISARDLGRTVPAMWLESTQNGATTDWGEFLAAVRGGRKTPVGQNFWRHQDIPAMAERWAGVVGADRLSLVTVPLPGAAPTVLWDRFAEVLGIDTAGYDLDVRANPSIGLATARLLVDINRRLQRPDGTLPPYYDKLVKHAFAKRGLVARQRQEPKLGLDEPWVHQRGAQQVRALKAAGHRVVGDLDELLPIPVAGVHADAVTAEQRLDAALDGIAHLLKLLAVTRRQARGGGKGRKGRGKGSGKGRA